jgi:hypothetical protein
VDEWNETTYTDNTVYLELAWAVGAATTGGSKCYAQLSEIWYSTEYIDFDTGSNLSAFVNTTTHAPAADLTAALGITPIIYFNNPDDTFQVNKGTGGDMAVTGALSDGDPSADIHY